MARHGSIAEQLSGLLALTQQPETVEPAQTNWSTVAASDNNPDDLVDLGTERRLAIRPSLVEIMRNVATEDIERGNPSTFEIVQGELRKVVEVPGAIIRIGKLRFSDGGQHERCTMSGIDGTPVVGMARMPTGAMLGAKEVQERPLGGSGVSNGESNAWFCEMFDCANRQYVPSGKRRKGRVYSRDEAAAMLAKAIANTPTMPKVHHCEDGVALGSARIADNFIGMKKSPKGNGGAIAWQDLSDKIAEREMYLDAERELSEKDRAVVDRLRTAKSYAEVDPGGSIRGAQKRGKRMLLAANSNLMDAIKKLSA